MGIHFLAITQLFLSDRAKMFMVTQETIIYRLVVRNHNNETFLKVIVFFGGKMGVGANGSGVSRPDQKVGPMDKPFGSTVISKTCFQNFRAKIHLHFDIVPPPSLFLVPSGKGTSTNNRKSSVM